MRITAKLQLTSPVLTQPDALRSALAKVVAETAYSIERDIKEQMAEPKSGRTYRRAAIVKRATKGTRALGLRERTGKRGGRLAIAGFTFHRASAPGEAPAIDSGALVNSVYAIPNGLHASVGTNLPYAAALEYGVFYSRLKDRGVMKIDPRPSFEPALERAREPFIAKCNEAVEALL